MCPRHPRARVKRDGYYGKDKQFVRWKCTGSGDDRPHLIRPELSTRLVGGIEGACDHCEPPWEPTDGLPQAVRDRFVLRHKVEALVALGKGESYRQSAWNARRSAGPPTAPGRTRSFSVDRRMTGDWVGQYASVLGDALLPHRWPYAIAVDEWEVQTVRYRDDGTRVQRGSDHYVVMAVVGYPNSRDPGRLWKLAARPSNSQAHWDSVFAELDPRGDRPPTILVADGAWGAWNAAGARWPDIRRYRCAWHREERARKRLAKAGYRSNSEPLVRLLQRRTATGRVPCDIFTDPFAYLTCRLALREETARTGLADLVTLERTLNADADLIWRELHEWHKPRSIGAVEEALDRVSHLLGDRARFFGNLPRLNELLKLIQLHLLRLTTPTTTPASCARTTSPTGARRRPDAATTAQGSRSGRRPVLARARSGRGEQLGAGHEVGIDGLPRQPPGERVHDAPAASAATVHAKLADVLVQAPCHDPLGSGRPEQSAAPVAQRRRQVEGTLADERLRVDDEPAVACHQHVPAVSVLVTQNQLRLRVGEVGRERDRLVQQRTRARPPVALPATR